MKILLLSDVKKIGRKNEIKEVPDGFANNMLIPKGLAIAANSPQAQRIAKKNQEKQASAVHKMDKTLESLSTISKIVFTEKTTPKGSLYHKITEKEIANHLQQEHKIQIPKKSISLKTPIKETGDYTVDVKIGSEKITLQISVES